MHNVGRKGKHTSSFMSKGYAQCYLHEKQEKMKEYHEHKKTHDLINKTRLMNKQSLAA
jgi:hypothetical protein